MIAKAPFTAAATAMPQPIRSEYGDLLSSLMSLLGSVAFNGFTSMSMPPKPIEIAMISHFLIGSPRMARPRNGARSVLVKNRLKALENEVNSKATKSKTSDKTPKTQRRSKSNYAVFGILKTSILWYRASM